MRKFRFIGMRFIVGGVLAVAVFSLVVMSLWNWLAPAVFGGHIINYWQALGLLVLSRILFGGFRGRRGHGMHGRYRFTSDMTPEEREKFRQGLRARCGRSSAGPASPASAA
jgi:hypothetical protein